MNHGLPVTTVQKIAATLAKFPQIERALLYGSRAKGTFKPGSDIDLALEGAALDLQALYRVDHELEELLLPYKIDLSLRTGIVNADLQAHIERVGIVLYARERAAAK